MNSRFAYISLLSLLLLGVAVSADAGDVILHPNGFGEHSYAAWKAQQGLPDSISSRPEPTFWIRILNRRIQSSSPLAFNTRSPKI